jgi:dihydrofolate reductase
VEAEFAAIWQAAEKVVYSTTLPEPSTSRTGIERSFEPDAVRDMKSSAERDLMIGGADLAAQAFRAGLVDECRLVLCPVAVGDGKPALPRGVRLDLGLVEHRRFENGSVYLRYRSVA